MSDTFEHQLLAYLDGMLDARARHAFLEEVARDPHKQQLLEQYRQLDARLRDRGTPVAVPLRTQQALAQRIPSLREVVPSTPLPAVTAGGLANGSKGAALFSVGRRIVGLLLIGGVLAIGVSLVAPSGRDERSAGAGTMSTEAPTLLPSTPQTLPAPSTAEPLAGSDVPSPAANTGHRSPQFSVHGSPLTSMTATPPATDIRNTTDIHNTTATPSATETRAVPAGRFLQEDDLAALFLIPRGDGAQRLEYPRGHMTSPLGQLLAGRLHLYLETGATPFTTAGAGGTETLPLSGVYLAGLRYRFSDRFAAGLDLGQSRFSRQRLAAHDAPLGDPGGSTVIVIDREQEAGLYPWLRLHGVYTFNPDSRLRIETDAGSGILLGEGNPVMLSSGLSVVYVVSTVLQLRAGLHGSGVWMSPGAPLLPDIESGDGVIGIIRRAEAAERSFTTSLDVRFGFGVYLW
ncbi:MAG: hypothetical protein KFF77_05400 [Bacteroidetes bacterium]|nr:hypothetical protein [Bacteroidota bacterium]